MNPSATSSRDLVPTSSRGWSVTTSSRDLVPTSVQLELFDPEDDGLDFGQWMLALSDRGQA